MTADILQELLVCSEAAQPVIEAISKLERDMDIIDSAVSRMDLDSTRLIEGLLAGALPAGCSNS